MKKSHIFNCSPSNLYFAIVNESMKKNGLKFEDAKVGLTFERELKNQLGQLSKINEEIIELEQDKKFVINITTAHDTYKLSYTFSKVESSTELIYEENYSSNKNLRYFNHLLMSFIYKRRINKKTETFFSSLEKIINNAS